MPAFKRGERTKIQDKLRRAFCSSGAPSGEFIEDLLETALAGARLSTADRALCQEMVYGVVRWQATLDWLIARKTGGREQKPALQNLLRLGLYQIFWLDRIPDHAAVHETVELAKHNGFGAQAGFVNAVLRGYLREADATKKLLAELKIHSPRSAGRIPNGWSNAGRSVRRTKKPRRIAGMEQHAAENVRARQHA